MAMTGHEVQAALEAAGRLVEARVSPAGTFGGWSGHDVLCHLAAHTRLVGAILAGEADGQAPTEQALYGRQLSPAERAIDDLDEVNAAIQREYAGLSYAEALGFWRTVHADALRQAARLSDAHLAAPGPALVPRWSRPHLADVVAALVSHYQGHLGA
jgi:hypothetical protein